MYRVYWLEQDNWGNWYVVSDYTSISYGKDYDGAEADCDYYNYRAEHGGED